jgi:DNA-binding response OmpR family regulator
LYYEGKFLDRGNFMALPNVVKFMILLESPIANSHQWQTFVYEAKELIKMLNKFETRAEIQVTDNFDSFLNILSIYKVDCFVFDWNYKECDILSLMAKIRKSNNFSNSTMIVLYDKKDEVDPNEYSALNINMAVTRPIFFENFNSDLKMFLEKKFSKLIPEDYNVLVVEQNQETTNNINDYLHKLEHKKISMVKSAGEAKKLIASTDFDLIIIEQNLSDGTCYDVIEHMRTFKERERLMHALPIVISDQDSIDGTMTLRLNRVFNQIIKPFDFFEFQEKLTYALENHVQGNKS